MEALILAIGSSAHLYWKLNKISCKACLLSFYFFGDKKIALKAPLTCIFISPLLSLEPGKKIHTEAVGGTGGRVFLFS